MVKLQPSKLIIRVRFPLPASPKPYKTMKMKQFLATALLAGMTFATVASAAALDDAKALAADKTAAIEDIGIALNQAVKESTTEAGKTPADALKAVISQRSNWTSAQLYYLCRAALMADETGTLAGKIQTVLEDCGISDRNIRVVMNSLTKDGALTPGTRDEQLNQTHSDSFKGTSGVVYPVIPGPAPTTRDN